MFFSGDAFFGSGGGQGIGLICRYFLLMPMFLSCRFPAVVFYFQRVKAKDFLIRCKLFLYFMSLFFYEERFFNFS